MSGHRLGAQTSTAAGRGDVVEGSRRAAGGAGPGRIDRMLAALATIPTLPSEVFFKKVLIYSCNSTARSGGGTPG